MQSKKVFVLLAIVAVFLILLIQNTGIVTFRFLMWKIQISQVALIIIVGAVAFAGGYFTHVVGAAVKRREGERNARS